MDPRTQSLLLLNRDDAGAAVWPGSGRNGWRAALNLNIVWLLDVAARMRDMRRVTP